MKKSECNISKIRYITDPYIYWGKHQILLTYVTQPPHGDFIYAILINGKNLPFLVYGRNFIFIGDNMVLLEAVKYERPWGPINSILIDLEKGMYANLVQWYEDITFFDNQIKLTSAYKKYDDLVLTSFDELQWVDL